MKEAVALGVVAYGIYGHSIACTYAAQDKPFGYMSPNLPDHLHPASSTMCFYPDVSLR